MPLGDAVRRHDARAVAGVDAGLLDVLHDAADDDGAGRVGERVDVELERRPRGTCRSGSDAPASACTACRM